MNCFVLARCIEPWIREAIDESLIDENLKTELLRKMMEKIITIETADEQGKPPEEEGIEIPLDRINPDTLRNMLSEFVTREWADEECTLESRMEQVLRQLRERKAKVMYDFRTETWNIVQCL